MILNKTYYKIRYCLWRYLIFSFMASGCAGKNGNDMPVLSLQWEQKKPVGLIISRKALGSVSENEIDQQLLVYVAGGNQQNAILGKYNINKDSVVFRPLIPFTPGLSYSVLVKDKVIGVIAVLQPDPEPPPVVLNVYPTGDTLPANLLKLYITFSKPMQEGQFLEHVLLIKDNRDTLPAVFLDLEPELWSNDRKMLTLWFDPGRIKRDLQPNIKMGPPLLPRTQYELVIKQDWAQSAGTSLPEPFRKYFVTGETDSRSPDINTWTIEPPKAQSLEKLQVDFHESLDYALTKNAVFIVDANGQEIKGTIETKKNETGFLFTPSSPWKADVYTIECEARMEDLAGNNMNRLFDNDLAGKERRAQKEIFKKTFRAE